MLRKIAPWAGERLLGFMQNKSPFIVNATDQLARRGVFSTIHGDFETPAFMPVGTQATVKGITPRVLSEIAAQIILTNTYHLHIRPGDQLIRDLGGIHQFMGWEGPILSDSGGYQVFSLAKCAEVSDQGVVFQSHVDGSKVALTPEKVIEIQENLGVDISMVLDHCPSSVDERSVVEAAVERTIKWAKRSRHVTRRDGNFLFGITQGGVHEDLRLRAIDELVALDFDGYAIGGVSVGEPSDQLYQIVQFVAPRLPEAKIRYLMGVGTPVDLVLASSYGVDLFDCVIPTRSARFGRLYIGKDYINIRNTRYRRDAGPIDDNCDCYTCSKFSRAYLAHLFHAKEVLAVELATVHNLRFYQQLMRQIREAISEKRVASLVKNFVG